MEKSDLISAKTAAGLLGVCELQFRKMARQFGFERVSLSPRRVGYSWSDIIERSSISLPPLELFEEDESLVLVDQKEAARRLGIAVNTFRAHAAKAGLARHKIGKRGVRYRWKEVLDKLPQVQI